MSDPAVQPLRDYARKARRDEVVVASMLAPGVAVRRDIQKLWSRLGQAGQKFGFRFVPGTDMAPPPTEAALTHLILIEDRPFDLAAVQHARAALASWGSVSIAFAYPDRAEMLAAEAAIEAAKAAAGPALNFLFPDESLDGWCIVSDTKIVDNAVCDTVRVKYEPQRASAVLGLEPAERQYFAKASRLYEVEQLYLRAPTDGYIAMRRSGGFLITATRTNKVGLDPARICWVQDYAEATNTLSYSGPYLPSSDAVEGAILLQALPQIDFILHTHASRLFTRNPAYRDRVLVPQLPYGEPTLGHALAAAFRRVDDGFVIMAEHGEVFVGAGDPDAFLGRVAGWCAEARRGLGHA